VGVAVVGSTSNASVGVAQLAIWCMHGIPVPINMEIKIRSDSSSFILLRSSQFRSPKLQRHTRTVGGQRGKGDASDWSSCGRAV
jgi:hypothetical protein